MSEGLCSKPHSILPSYLTASFCPKQHAGTAQEKEHTLIILIMPFLFLLSHEKEIYLTLSTVVVESL